ncbi:flagellar biosynthesis protein FlhF [Paenibacillus marinisediminis]
MRVKKYLVETMPEAMSLIRQELGKDAVIVSTKEVKTGGFAGMFRKRMIEVTAAVDHTATKRQESEKPTPAARPAVPASLARNVYSSHTSRDAASQTAAAAERGVELDERPVRQVAPPQEDLPVDNLKPVNTVRQETVNAFEISSTARSNARHEAADVQSNQDIREELKEMKAMVLAIMHKSERDAWPEFVKSMEQQLLKQGVFSDLAHRFVHEAWTGISSSSNAISTEIAFKQQLKDVLKRHLAGHAKGEISNETNVIYLAGPTGVGKTTTIAKLAADQMFKNRRKVGFITSDTFRIAAVEQLRTYASILNAPLEVVTSPNDLQRALRELQDCDLVLMDTAGRNYRNELYVNELFSMIKPLAGSETFLVLSLTMKTEDMLSILERFKHQSIQRIVFTKSDETDSYGVLLNVADRTGIPFSYVTYGQNVPDDIKSFAPDEWIDKLLGAQ